MTRWLSPAGLPHRRGRWCGFGQVQVTDDGRRWGQVEVPIAEAAGGVGDQWGDGGQVDRVDSVTVGRCGRWLRQ
jgi:hypothetical protein